jgi:formylglycine-generating enzyme required for sulfatase activity
MDVHDVTNAEFAKFVEATGYVTTAERPINWEDLKKELAPVRRSRTRAPLLRDH